MDASRNDALMVAALAAGRDGLVVLETVSGGGRTTDFAVVTANARGHALFGVAQGERLSAVVPAGRARSLVALCAATLDDGRPRADEWHPGGPTEPEWIERQVVRLPEARLALTLRDVTARRSDHDRLRRSEAASEALAEEQAALRRATEAVAHDEPPESVIALITEEIARLVGADRATVARFDEDAIVTVGAWGQPGPRPGTRYPRTGNRSLARVALTGRPQRSDYASLRRDDAMSAQVVPADCTWGLSAPIRVAARSGEACSSCAPAHANHSPPTTRPGSVGSPI